MLLCSQQMAVFRAQEACSPVDRQESLVLGIQDELEVIQSVLTDLLREEVTTVSLILQERSERLQQCLYKKYLS